MHRCIYIYIYIRLAMKISVFRVWRLRQLYNTASVVNGNGGTFGVMGATDFVEAADFLEAGGLPIGGW